MSSINEFTEEVNIQITEAWPRLDPIIKAQAKQVLAMYDSKINFQGFINTKTPTPDSYVEGNAWIASQDGTIFGITASKGDLIFDNGAFYEVRNVSNFDYWTDKTSGLCYRQGVVDDAIVVDRELTSAGFDGMQGTDWERLSSLSASYLINKPIDASNLTTIIKNLQAQSSTPNEAEANNVYLDDGTNSSSGKPALRKTDDGTNWYDLQGGDLLAHLLYLENNVMGDDIANAANVVIGNKGTGQYLSGENTTLIGSFVGRSSLSGSSNTGIGKAAFFSLTEGSYNIAIGNNCLAALDTGDYNTAIGYKSQGGNKYGSRNISIGSEALNELIDGSYNASYGVESLLKLKYGTRNCGAGYKTLRLTRVGDFNTAIGYKAMQDALPDYGDIANYSDNGDGTTRVTSAGHGLSEGDEIKIRGTSKFFDHDWTGNYDGNHIISNVTTDTFDISVAYIDESNLVALGIWKRKDAGLSNTAIGATTGWTLKNGSYNLLIGDNVEPDDPDGDYQVNISNVIKGSAGTDKWIEVQGGFGQAPLSSDPADPDNGHSIQWVSDGTGSGDAGDVIMKINVGGTVKIITLVDFSAE